MQVDKNRASSVGLIMNMRSLPFLRDDSRLRKAFQFALHGPHAYAGRSHHLAQVKGLVGMAEKQSKHMASRFAEESRRKPICRFCTHFGFNCTRIGFIPPGIVGGGFAKRKWVEQSADISLRRTTANHALGPPAEN